MNRQEKTIILFSSLFFTIAVIGTVVIPDVFNSIAPTGGQFAGLVLKLKGDVRIRFGDSVNWKKLAERDKIYSSSYLFTGEQSNANFGFIDESSLSLGSNSLVYVGVINNRLEKSKNENLQIDLVNGSVQVDLKKLSQIQSIKVGDAVIKLNKKSSTIRLQNNPDSMEVSIMQGDVQLTSKEGEYNIKSGEKLEIKSGEKSQVAKMSPELIKKMKKISDEDRKMLMDELHRNRNISSVIANILERLVN